MRLQRWANQGNGRMRCREKGKDKKRDGNRNILMPHYLNVFSLRSPDLSHLRHIIHRKAHEAEIGGQNPDTLVMEPLSNLSYVITDYTIF